jgi:hypothetical protein
MLPRPDAHSFHLAAQGAWQPLLSLGSSLAAGVLLLALAAYDFLTADY